MGFGIPEASPGQPKNVEACHVARSAQHHFDSPPSPSTFAFHRAGTIFQNLCRLQMDALAKLSGGNLPMSRPCRPSVLKSECGLLLHVAVSGDAVVVPSSVFVTVLQDFLEPSGPR